MAANAIACASCSWPLPAEVWNRAEAARCPGCRQNVRVAVFPAIISVRAGASPEAIQGETEAACFYHPGSRAAIPCQECGRFLCHLCDLEVEGRHICPRCFESGVGAHSIVTAEPRRMMYDTMALLLATLPALVISPAIIGAPWSLFLVVRHWNSPGSIVPRTRVRFILAALLALAEIGFLIFIVYMMIQLGVKVGSRPPRSISI